MGMMMMMSGMNKVVSSRSQQLVNKRKYKKIVIISKDKDKLIIRILIMDKNLITNKEMIINIIKNIITIEETMMMIEKIIIMIEKNLEMIFRITEEMKKNSIRIDIRIEVYINRDLSMY